MQRIFKISKWLHKYIGLVLLLFIIWMSISGILMNHPNLISGISVPSWLLPPQYKIQNWNRSALTDLVFSSKNSNTAYLAGKQGIWKTVDAGQTFTPFTNGLPNSDYYNKTKDLLLLEESNLLLAGTNGGLYACNLNDGIWQSIKLAEEKEQVVKILKIENQLVAVTPSGIFLSPIEGKNFHFKKAHLTRQESQERISLVKLFFDLHDGRIWGLPGKLIFDATGLIIIFLSLSAFYTWYFPWQRRRNKNSVLLSNPKSRRLFKFMFKYHLKIGIWIFVVLLIISGTGLFMRPPLLVALAGGSIPASLYPGFREQNPWEEKIQNALYDAVEDKVILQCTDGFWVSKNFHEPFAQSELPAPVFVMGATVFEPYGAGGYLVGSFNGIYHLERESQKVIDLLTNKEAKNVSPMKPGDYMVTGYFKTPDGKEFITNHEKGLVAINGAMAQSLLNMPEEMMTNPKFPLWNYLFEIHNGRFFQDITGKFYILILPIGSLLFILISVSGLYDWLFLNVLRKTHA